MDDILCLAKVALDHPLGLIRGLLVVDTLGGVVQQIALFVSASLPSRFLPAIVPSRLQQPLPVSTREGSNLANV
jgi:hypothetical protein